ncbi:cadherin-like domain-containing protein [Roseiconus nitratireducens]|uniref:cadherin-like domain-containing protein n=1 Tax=Roseiconus nitratireducens TaxID=2605748 RepID=UPI0013754F04|nr:cadherin-like domain-containing protein [Roseiconus nitratireducens]
MSTQALEQRQLLAGDLAVAHNYWNSFDVNQDHQVSPSDALRVINYLAANSSEGELGDGDAFAGNKVDVNADGKVSPSDALGVINALGRGEQMTPLVEYFLTARDHNDNPLPVNNGVVEVGVGQENSFFLEVSYNDLRTFGNDIGAFTVVTDLGVSQGGVLRPVLRETQRIIIGEEILTASSGTITIGAEGTSTTYVSDFSNFAASPTTEIANALAEFGYSPSDYELTQFDIGSGDDLGFQIHYTGDDVGNVDLPDPIVTINLDVSVPVTVQEFAPFEADGVTPNGEAVRFNIDTRSRTFNNNEDFYDSLNRGDFDLASGFDELGGVGGVPASGGGIKGLSDDGTFIEPFDAFSFEVFLSQEVASLVVDVNPGESIDALTLYGEDNEVPEDLIVVDEDARVTLSTGAVQNNPPVLGTSPLTATVNEDDASSQVDLLLDATDADGDTLSIADFTVTGGDDSGITVDGSTLTIDPSAYNSLALGGTEVITATYNVTDGIANTSQSLTITVNGANDAPTVGGPVTFTTNEDAAQASVDLLDGAADVDGDTLSISDFTVTGGDDSGITLNGTTLSVDPSAYDSLADGESEVITATYNVTDGTANTAQTATITITGVNDPPTVSQPITTTTDENSGQVIVDLLQVASDIDGDALTATSIVLRAGSGDDSGVTIDAANNRLLIDTNAYDALNTGESVSLIYDYTIEDGNGGSVSQVATINIDGITDEPNENPTVTGPISATFSEDDADASVDLLEGASDPDQGDTLSVNALQLVSGDGSGITQDGNELAVSPDAYNSLAVGESEVVVYQYSIIDGRGGTVSQMATITINGANDAPSVAGPLTTTIGEDDGSTEVDLLGNASDPDDSDSLTVENLALVSGDASGFTVDGNTVTVDPSVYNDLAVSESEQVIYSYDISDGNGGTVSQTATITISGANDAPTVGNAITATVNEDDATTQVNLLTGAADPDASDVLAVDSLALVSGDGSGITLSGNSLSIDPSQYNALAAGESEVVVYSYDVIDGNGGSVSQSATITITGSNDAPTVSGDLTFTYNEDQPQQVVSLLDGATDPDGDTLTIENVQINGDDRGISVSGSDLTITPDAYGDLLDAGEQSVITLTYDVSDGNGGTVSQTATVTIEGRDEGIPTVSGPITATFNEDDADATIDLLEGASDPDSDPLSVINATVTSGDARGVTIDAANNRLLINPSAYNDLNTGETVVVVVSYEITDVVDGSVSQTATITFVGEDEPAFVPSSISGQLYIDEVENIQEVLKGADPIRNGVKDSDEDGLGGIEVRLLQVTGEGESELATTLTDNDGNYAFENLEPGTYVVEYVIPASIQYNGSTRQQFVIGPEGGEDLSGPNLSAVGVTGSLHRIDLLAKTYLAAGIADTGSGDAQSGGVAQLNADGTQAVFIAGEGFESVEYAEIALNDARDAALLTIMDDGVVKSVQLEAGQFVVNGDATAVRFFGTVDDFDWVESPDSQMTQEFDDYRNAIDRILGDES